MLIKEISLDDSADYQRLVHLAYQPVQALGIHFAAATAPLEMIEAHIKSNAVYAISQDGKLVCTLSLRLPWGNNPGPFGVPHIGWVATHPDYKKQGLASELLRWVEQNILITQLKVPFVSLGTAENHPWLSAFYVSHGFTEVSRVDLTSDHTTIFYRKILNPELFQLWSLKHPTA